VPSLRLWLCGGTICAGPPVLAILTWDAVATWPVRRIAADEDENGRGLAIIEALSARWGFYHPASYPGKVTWAVIETP